MTTHLPWTSEGLHVGFHLLLPQKSVPGTRFYQYQHHEKKTKQTTRSNTESLIACWYSGHNHIAPKFSNSLRLPKANDTGRERKAFPSLTFSATTGDSWGIRGCLACLCCTKITHNWCSSSLQSTKPSHSLKGRLVFSPSQLESESELTPFQEMIKNLFSQLSYYNKNCLQTIFSPLLCLSGKP